MLPRLSIPALICTLLIAANAHAATWIKLHRIKEQAVDTPVPIFVKVYHKPNAASVVLYYHPASQEEWSRETMTPTHRGFGAVIPCEGVKKEAIVEFYVQVEKHGRPIAHSGSKKKPHAVAFVETLKGKPPALPGEDPPEKCQEEEKVVLTPSPDEESEKPPKKSEPPDEEQPSGKARRIWASLGIVQDLAVVGGKDVCSPEGEKKAFYCFRSDGKQYLGFPVMGDHDTINNGLTLSATRIMAGLDYVLGSVAVGGRVGFTVHSRSPKIQGGKSSQPFLAAVRAEYWFADHAYATQGFSLYVLAEGGTAESDAKNQVVVVNDPSKTSVQTNPPIQKVDAWKRMGLGYGALGLGGFVPVGGSGGVVIEVAGRVTFPASGFVIAPGAYYALGF